MAAVTKGNTMKPWQNGYELDYLKKLEAFWDEEHNTYADSPFAKLKKNDIAGHLSNKCLFLRYPTKLVGDHLVEDKDQKPLVGYTVKLVKVKGKIVAYNDVVIGEKQVGDIVVNHLAGDHNELERCLHQYKSRNTWLFVWAENKAHCQIAERCGFSYVFGKMTTFGEIYAVYFRDAIQKSIRLGATITPRSHCRPRIEDAEKINVKKLIPVNNRLIDVIRNKLEEGVSSDEFTDHYSNYNKKHTWGALSLRGYTPDPAFIAKPIEMSKKWKADNANKHFQMTWTPLIDKFDEVKELLKIFGDAEIHRVRFMQLAPGHGELRRHSDLVDPEIGVKLGNIGRFHFPILTNPKVIFTSWNYDGAPTDIHMEAGNLYYLDIRKPHRAINGGAERRIHLVVDVEITPKTLELING